ncbi:MAG: hypothetical protein WDN49_22775 [Acetobacteraceae bacterium]
MRVPLAAVPVFGLAHPPAQATGRDDAPGTLIRPIESAGRDGAARAAPYTMAREADGSWRIAARILLESRRVGA